MVDGEVAGLAGLDEHSHWLRQHIADGVIAGLVVELGELSRWLQQQMAVGEVAGLSAEWGELSHWLE